MGGYLSFNVKPREDDIRQELKKLTIEKVTEVLDFVKIQYNGTFLLTEAEFEDVNINDDEYVGILPATQKYCDTMQHTQSKKSNVINVEQRGKS